MLVNRKVSWRHNSIARTVLTVLKRVVHPALLRDPGYRRHRGAVLPPPEARMGGLPYRDDGFFLDSAIGEARRVMGRLQSESDDLLLDFGCGEGRLAIGLIHEGSALRYLGLDVKRDAIAWCNEHLARRHPAFRFEHIDVVNARYNPHGRCLQPGDEIPVATSSADIVYAWGVLTNMEPEHFPPYAREFSRVLRPGGRLFLTAHVEDGVPAASVNPDGYTPYACDGPLHAVRYESGYFLETLREAGFVLDGLDHHAAGNCQSELYFQKP